MSRGRVDRVKIYKISDQGLEPTPFEFTLNPNSLERSRKVDWIMLNSPGSAGGLSEFVKVNDQNIKLEILLASNRANSEQHEKRYGVIPQLAYLESLTIPNLDLFLTDNAQFVQPPSILLVWGERSFRGEVHNITISEMEYDNKLNPVLAKVSLDIVTSHVTFSGIVNEMDQYAINIDKLYG